MKLSEKQSIQKDNHLPGTPGTTTCLGVDPGEKRTGLAVGDVASGIASPIGVIVTRDAAERLRRILETAAEYEAHAIVIGLPLNMDGTLGPAAERARDLADQLRHATNLPVHLFDERLTSYAADQQMARTGLTHQQKQNRRDALAAATILRDFFSTGRL